MSKPYLLKTREMFAALIEAETSIVALALRFNVTTKSVRAALDRHVKSGAVKLRRLARPGLPFLTLCHIPDPTALPNEALLPTARVTCKKGTRHYQSKRPCLGCRKSFYSDGPHNRLCTICGSKSTTPFDI